MLQLQLSKNPSASEGYLKSTLEVGLPISYIMVTSYRSDYHGDMVLFSNTTQYLSGMYLPLMLLSKECISILKNRKVNHIIKQYAEATGRAVERLSEREMQLAIGDYYRATNNKVKFWSDPFRPQTDDSKLFDGIYSAKFDSSSSSIDLSITNEYIAQIRRTREVWSTGPHNPFGRGLL